MWLNYVTASEVDCCRRAPHGHVHNLAYLNNNKIKVKVGINKIFLQKSKTIRDLIPTNYGLPYILEMVHDCPHLFEV